MAGGIEQRREEPPRAAEPAQGAVSVGLTGGLAAGKSAALAFFAELGARTIAADEVVSSLYEQAEVRAALRERFGDCVLDPDGLVDRGALGRLVAQDRDALAWLEGLVHPLVGRALRAFLQSAAPGELVVCEVPLLFQSNLEPVFDLVVTIEAEPELRRERRRARGGAEIMDDLDKLQLSSEERVRRSDLAFVNDGTLDDLKAFVAAAYEVARTRFVGRVESGRSARGREVPS